LHYHFDISLPQTLTNSAARMGAPKLLVKHHIVDL
jgi:hypothetical protein